MVKNNNQILYIIGIVAVVLLFSINKIQSSISTSKISPKIIFKIPDVEKSIDCSLSLNKYIIDSGEIIKGTIKHKNSSECDIFAKINNLIWIKLGNITLDETGQISYETPITTPGNYEVLAVCRGQVNDCKTNSEILEVKS